MINNRKCVLIIEDDKKMRIGLRHLFMHYGFEVLEASNGEEGLEIFSVENQSIDLILVDVMMPVMNGIEFVRVLRTYSQLPTIMLTAKNQDEDQLLGFDIGVDDYIAKPFSTEILIARVNALMKRVGVEHICLGNLTVDQDKRSIKVLDQSLTLTKKEYDLILYFLRHRENVLSRQKILDDVWGIHFFGDERTVDTHVKQIRRKLKEANVKIETVFGVGYKLRLCNEN